MTEYIRFYLDRDDLESKLGGGIPKGSLIIIEGEDGGGKSIVSQRVTYGALVNGHSVTYISTELNVIDFIKQMDSLAYDVSDYLLSKKLVFVSLINLFGKTKGKSNLIFELRKSKSKKLFENDLVIIDSLSYPLIDKLSRQQIEELVDFFLRLRAMNRTILLTYNPNDVDQEFVKALRRIADIYLKVGVSTLAGQLTRFIEVKRFRNPREMYSLLIPFRVEPRLGLIVEIVTIV